MNMKALERAHRRADVAQQGDPGLDDVGDGAHRLGRLRPHRAVIGWVGRVISMGKRSLCFSQSKFAAVDQDAADRGAVAADVFGRRVKHDRGAMIERPVRSPGRLYCP